MAETEFFKSEEGRDLPASEETCERVPRTPTGEDRSHESDSVVQPLLRHAYQDSCDENYKASMQTATAGADPETSVPQEQELAIRDQCDCTGSVRSVCSSSSSSSSSRRECPICSEQFDVHGDHRVTLLNCDHALCHNCTAGIMRRAKEPGRLRCPFCRQTTPFPQWEIRMLQEESYYCGGVYEAGPALVVGPGPDLQVIPARRQQEARMHTSISPSCLVRGLRLMRLHSLCVSFTVFLLLFLLCWVAFCIFVPLIILSKVFSNG
ncbi:uncharacterized protein [Antennarius striatus]|uniref:uncharacterized protein n=1 Tax=Antennarius striatus TaxID=241820 RepID=UPI0035B33007